MKMQKNKVLNFFIACIPGAGQMHLGFMKRGFSLMVIFFGLIAVSAWINMEILMFALPVIWFFSFFDSLNRNALPLERFEMLEDEFIWEDDLGASLSKGRTVRKIVAAILIIGGSFMLLNNAKDIVRSFVGDEAYWMYAEITHYVYQILIAFVIIGIGIKLIVGKKKELNSQNNLYVEKKAEAKEEM